MLVIVVSALVPGGGGGGGGGGEPRKTYCRGVSESFYTVPYRTTDCLPQVSISSNSSSSSSKAKGKSGGGRAYTHGESTTKVIEDDPWTGIASVIHCASVVGAGLWKKRIQS